MPEPLVPAIDIGPFERGSDAERQLIAEQVDTACRGIGFLVLSGHSIPRQYFDDVFAADRAFFDLPEGEKRQYMSPGELEFLGYTAPLTRNVASTLGEERPPDLREIYTVGPGDRFADDFADMPGAEDLYAPNIWPRRPEGFADVHLRLYTEMEALAARMMRIFALALGLPEEYFGDKIDRHFSPLGSFNYPALSEPPRPGQLRCGAHTDFGSLTMLAMEEPGGGLQIQQADGVWLDVTPGTDELVVNIGDMMARWTNDRWTSTLHRVAVPQTEDLGARRQSIGYFLHPNYGAEVRCLESCTAPDNPPKYPPVLCGTATYKKLTARIDRGEPA